MADIDLVLYDSVTCYVCLLMQYASIIRTYNECGYQNNILAACRMNMSQLGTMKGECTAVVLLNIQCVAPNDVAVFILLLIYIQLIGRLGRYCISIMIATQTARRGDFT